MDFNQRRGRRSVVGIRRLIFLAHCTTHDPAWRGIKAEPLSGLADADQLCQRKRFIFVGLRMPRTGLLHHLRLACHESHRCSESLDRASTGVGRDQTTEAHWERQESNARVVRLILPPTVRANHPASELYRTASIEATECSFARSKNQRGKNAFTHFPPHKQKIQSPLSDWIL